MEPETRYAKSGDIHIAYQVFGDGTVNLVFCPGFVSHLENHWEEPSFARWLRGLGNFARVVMFDKRGTGLSDRLAELPGMDERIEDVRAVMDAVGMDRGAILGVSEGGSLACFFAATHPQRCQALVLYGAFAQFSSWFPTAESLEQFIGYIDTRWGSGATLPSFAPSMADDPGFRRWWGRFERLGASPAAAMALMRVNSEIDILDILPSIHLPTLVIHREGDLAVDVAGGRALAAHIPGARLVEVPGIDHLPWVGANSDEIIEVIEEFLTGSRSAPDLDRVLATVLFTDIVGSTERAAALGDQGWRNLLNAHDRAVRQELARFRGREVKALGDGFLATFDGPARAIRCGIAVRAALRRLGLAVRIGIHTGEVELVDREVRGIAVHIASRVADVAGPGEIMVSRTVKDLVAGSGLILEPAGTHALKGVADSWQLYRVGG
jgi:class 3 adenylate cyclase